MKILLRIYSASCLIVLGFFTFFLIPWGLLPFSDAVNIMAVGAILLGFAAFYIQYFYRREGLDLGWFLANRGGLWAIAVAVLGVVAIFCGSLLYFWPGLYVPAFEQGALPFGIAIVSFFWLALIFMFGYLAVGMVARVTAYIRKLEFAHAIANALVAFVCVGLAGVFFSLFVEVINDIAIRIYVPTQWNAIWIFVGALIVSGVVYGFWEMPADLVDDEATTAAAE
jgi:hypothetical protein